MAFSNPDNRWEAALGILNALLNFGKRLGSLNKQGLNHDSRTHIGRYLEKYLREDSGRERKPFNPPALPRLEVAQSQPPILELDNEPDFRKPVEILVEIQLPDGSRSAGFLFLNSDVALDVARHGVGPLPDISGNVTVSFGGIHLKGKPIVVRQIILFEKTSLAETPVERNLVDGGRSEIKKVV